MTFEKFGAMVRFARYLSDYLSHFARDVKAMWSSATQAINLIPDLLTYWLPESLLLILVFCFIIALLYKILGREG